MSDEVRQELERLCRERGEDFATLSRLIGRNPSYIQQFVRRGTPRRLDEADRQRLARYLGVSEECLGARAPALPDGLRALHRHADDALAPPLCLALPATLLCQLGAGAIEALFLFRVSGDSMAPTLVGGDELIVDGADGAGRLRDGLYVLRQGAVMQVRRLSLDPSGTRVRVQTDNAACADWDDCPPDALDIVGRVAWIGRRAD